MVKVNHDIREPDEGTIWFDYFTVYDPSGHERTPSPKTPLSKGLIAGAITGSIIGLVFLFLVAYFWMRRRRLRWKDETGRRHPYYAERGQDPRDHPEEKRGDLESFCRSLISLALSSHLFRTGEARILSYEIDFRDTWDEIEVIQKSHPAVRPQAISSLELISENNCQSVTPIPCK